MTEKEKKVVYNQLAELILGPITNIVDTTLTVKPELFDSMKEALENLEDVTSTTAAWPFQETMNKAREMHYANKFFEAIINMFEKRKEFLEYMQKGKMRLAGDDVLRHLGML